MDINEHMKSGMLVRYSFLWSEVRLVLAAIALFLGGKPLVTTILNIPLAGALLVICWVVSGIASGYLVYRWYTGEMKVFGGNETKDVVAFWVMVVSGINLGIVGILGRNIGMSISSNKIVFIVVGLLYLASAYHLHKRWKANGEKIF